LATAILRRRMKSGGDETRSSCWPSTTPSRVIVRPSTPSTGSALQDSKTMCHRRAPRRRLQKSQSGSVQLDLQGLRSEGGEFADAL
jgi:hypothetical protein